MGQTINDVKYRVQHTYREIGESCVFTLNTETVYEGSDRAVAEKMFCEKDFSFGESSTLLVFKADINELIRFYERSK